mgnify:CR=1 FL=1
MKNIEACHELGKLCRTSMGPQGMAPRSGDAADADADGRAHFLLRVARPHPMWWQGVLSRGIPPYDLLGLAPLALGVCIGESLLGEV